MKFMRFCALSVLFTMTAAGICSAVDTPPPPQAIPFPGAKPAAPASQAVIEFDNPTYEFGKVASGEKVRHTYMVTNTGTETLQITNVHPGCHCTTPGEWTHSIEPGKTGRIPIQFDSAGFGSGPITRTVDVYSNAKNEPHKILMLKGLIWKPIEYASAATVMIPADSTEVKSTSVRIVNQTDNPVTFSNAVSSKPQLFDAALKEVKPGKEYDLLITAHPPFPAGNTGGTITVNTSLPGTPTITVSAMAKVTPSVEIRPSQIVLNSLPDRSTTNVVTILCNTMTNFALSNAKASDNQIQVSIKPGYRAGMFNLTIVTPPNFHLETGQRAEVTVESNHPHNPTIQVPIMQIPRPKPYAAPPPTAAHT
jgi:Protein of unknown function (DUF1573)